MDVEIEPVYKKKRGIVLLRQVDDMVYVSGHGPEDQITGKPLFQGRIGKDLTLEEGYAAARECAIIILGALKDTFGSLDNIRIIKAFGLVNCAEEFYDVEKFLMVFQIRLQKFWKNVDTMQEQLWELTIFQMEIFQ